MTLPIKRDFLRQIIAGEKKIEYRDMTDFYISRFCVTDEKGDFVAWRPIDQITLRAGYSKDAAQATVSITHVELVELIDEKGEGTNQFLFAIHIGAILH